MIRRRVLWLVVVAVLAPACVQPEDVRPDCRLGDDEAEEILTLAAQAVPTATVLPCLDVLLSGWDYGGSRISDGAFRFWLASDRVGLEAARVELTAECDVSDAVEVIPAVDEVGTRRFEEPISLGPRFASNRYYRFPGGCVTVEYRFGAGAPPTLVLEADQAIGFTPRRALVERLAERGLVLCGAGAPACPGGD